MKRPSEYAEKLIPLGTLVQRATDSRLHVYRVRAWLEPSEDQFFPVCLADDDGKEVYISYLDVSPLAELAA